MRSSAIVLALACLTLAGLGSLACDRTPEPRSEPRVSPPPPVSVATRGEPEAGASYRLPSTPVVVAVGDLHGDLNALRAALRLAGAIDSDAHWIGRDLTVVQTGDQLDRGDQDREVLDELERLEAEARRGGGALVTLLGNHELMNASFDFRYVSPQGFAAFAEFAGRAGGAALRLPQEQRGRAAAFTPGTLYAQKLSAHLTIAQVGDTLFAHGGVLPAHLEYGFDRLNRDAQAFLAGRAPLPPILASDDAPTWTRAYGAEVDPATCAALERVLSRVGAKRLVVGHTVQQDRISSACDGHVFRIDVGLSAYYGQHPVQVLELSAEGPRVLGGNAGAAAAAPAKPFAAKPSQAAAPALHSTP